MVENYLPVLLLVMAFVTGVSLAPLSYSDYPPPLQQIRDDGVNPEDVQCNAGLVHAVRANGAHVCVKETTAKRLGWEIFVAEDAPVGKAAASGAASEGAGGHEVIISTYSTVEFVDDGREVKRSTLQRAPAPMNIYDTVMDSEINPGSAVAGSSARIQSETHKKYSVNPGVGFYIEDWMPTRILDGQKLLYADTGCHPSGDCYLNIQFVPTTFTLNKNITNYDLDVSKGYLVYVEYNVVPFDEIEDTIEYIREVFESQPGVYGGFVNMTRDGKTVLAHEGGSDLNHYRASLGINLDEHTRFWVGSNYHTLAEITPVFESMGN